MATDARKTALLILNRLEKSNQTLDLIIDDVLDESSPLSRRDRGLTSALVYGVQRWRGQLDWIIAHFSKTPLNKISPDILNILRIGVFQIVHLSRIPDSAAVNTSVNMAKKVAPPWIVKFVNGLLRNVTRKHQEINYPDINRDPVKSISTEKSFPGWLIKKWIERFGVEETLNLCDHINQIPSIAIRTNTLKTNRDNLISEIGEDVSTPEPLRFSPEGISFTSPKTSIPEMGPFIKGLFQVQDEAAQLVSILLNPGPGERILDACSGLGGKTGHIAQLMNNTGSIVAMDHEENKLNKLKKDMDRLGVSIVKTVTHDLSEIPDTELIGTFDKILLDAPCSGMGVLRRNPDSKWSLSKKNLKRYRERQLLFLSNLVPLLKPGGSIVYAVCSTEPEENEFVIDKFLEAHSGFCIDKFSDIIKNVSLEADYTKGYLRTYPHKNDMDGFFSVCLKHVTR